MGVEEFNFPGENEAHPEHPMAVRSSDGTAFQGGVDNPLAVRLSDGEQFGPIQVGGVGSFGDLITAEIKPQAQMDFVYGSNLDTQTQDAASGGAVSFADSMVVCGSGVSIGGSALLKTRASARYRPGQGQIIRISGVFSAAAPGVRQLVGADAFGENGLFFGVDDVTGLYGVCRMHDGFRGIQSLTISTSASGAETGTVTLDGSDTNVALTSGSDEETAQEVAEETYPGWQVWAVADRVYFMADDAEPKAGAFAFSSTGTAAGTMAEERAGVEPTYTWTPRTGWNTDQMDGDGPSKQTIDITKGNIYAVKFQYLGFGGIEFLILNSETGLAQLVHRIKYANTATVPLLGNPTLSPGVSVKNVSAAIATEVKSASMASFTEGDAKPLGHHHGVDVDTNISSQVPVLSIRNNVAFIDGTPRLNVRDMIPHLLSVATNGGSKPMKFSLILDGTPTDPLWEFYDQDHSPVSVDTSATAITGGDAILAAGIPKDGGHIEPLVQHLLRLLPGQILSVVMEPIGSAAEVTAGLVWREDT